MPIQLKRMRIYIRDGTSINTMEEIISEMTKKGIKIEKSFESIGIIICKIRPEQIAIVNSFPLVDKIEVEE